MDALRENRPRGTSDCPIALYHISTDTSGMISPVHWHPEFEILLVHKGSIHVRTGTETFLLRAGSVAFIHPNELHAMDSAGGCCEYDAFVVSLDLLALSPTHFFTRDFVTPLQSGTLLLPRVLLPDTSLCQTVSEALKRILLTETDTNHFKITAFTAIVEVCAAVFHIAEMRIQSDTAEHNGNIAVKACIRYLEWHYEQPLTLDMIASHVHLHPNYLCSLFKKYTGETVFQHLHRIRVEKAAVMLRDFSMSVSQVSEMSGFESVSFFTRKFKEITGFTPGQYKKRV